MLSMSDCVCSDLAGREQLLCKKEIVDAAPEGADLSTVTITIPPVEKDSKPLGDRISRRLSPEEEAAEAAAAAKKMKEGEADAINEDEAWILNRKKSLVMHSGCDPANSERIGLLTNKMPVRILELRTVRLRALSALDCPSWSSGR